MKYFLFQILVVKKEKYVWLMEMPQQEEWKFVSVVSGVWCVITTGISEMPELLAKNLDYHSNVSNMFRKFNKKKPTSFTGHIFCNFTIWRVWSGRDCKKVP